MGTEALGLGNAVECKAKTAEVIPLPAWAAWKARGFNLLIWYAKHFGITDQDMLEANWLADWVKRHHNRLRYCPLTCRWIWVDHK
jgi:hypothetical protein